MTPKEKALSIIDKFRTYPVMWTGGIEVETANLKQCALIVVDECIEWAKALDNYGSQRLWKDEPDYETCESYLIKVKQEIEKYNQ